MKPKKILVEIARANGTIDRMNTLFSAMQILNAQANSFAQECGDLLESNGLMMGRLKQLHNNFIKASDNYFREFASCVFDEKRKMDMFRDMDDFAEVFYKWSGIERNFTPKQIEIKGKD